MTYAIALVSAFFHVRLGVIYSVGEGNYSLKVFSVAKARYYVSPHTDTF